MPSNFGTISTQTIKNSITYKVDTEAIDYNEPLPFTSWINYLKDFENDNTKLINGYRLYLSKWYSAKKIKKETEADFIRSSFVNLLREIILSYSTIEERRFISNIDFTNNDELYSVIPFFNKKFKDICNYYNNLRQTIKFSKYRNSSKGSIDGLEKILTNTLLDSVQAGDLSPLFKSFNLSLSGIKQNLNIKVQELYDDTQYMDISPNLPIENYGNLSTDRLTFSGFNINEIVSDVFLNFDDLIIDSIRKYPFFIDGLDTPFNVNVQVTANDLIYLKDRDFINLVNTSQDDPENVKSNLAISLQKEFIEKFIGTDYYYISTNSTGTEYVSSILFKASEPFANILNKRYPTTATVQNEKLLKNIKNLGGFFCPDKLGYLNFNSFRYDVNVDKEKLEPNKIYIFPDPYKFGNIRGLTQEDYDSPPLIYSEDVSWFRENRTKTYIYGNIKSNPVLKNFYGYYSRSQVIGYQATGMSRSIDSTEFFKGIERDEWANIDVFPLSGIKYPIDARQESLLVINKTLVKFQTDIYGNSYGIYKDVYPTGITRDGRSTDEFISEVEMAFFNYTGGRAGEDGTGRRGVKSNLDNFLNNRTKFCKILDGYQFFDSVYFYNFDYSIVDPAKGYSGVTTRTITQIPPGSGYYTPPLTGIYTTYNINFPYAAPPTFRPTPSPLVVAGYGSGNFLPDIFCDINKITFCLVLECEGFLDPYGNEWKDFSSDNTSFNNFVPVYYTNLLEGGLDINNKVPNFAFPSVFTSTIPISTGAVELLEAYKFDMFGQQPCVVDPNKNIDPFYLLDHKSIVTTPLDTNNYTSVKNISSNLFRNETLYDSRHTVIGDFYIKLNNNNSAVKAHIALEDVYSKYSDDIKDELINKVIDFNVYYNVIAIETENYLIIEKIDFDFINNKFILFSSGENVVRKSKNNLPLENISTIHYNDIERTLTFVRLCQLPELSTINSQVIYPEIYLVDISNPTLNKYYPNFELTIENLQQYNTNDLYYINLDRLDKPALTYNENSKNYLLNYFVKNPNNVFLNAFVEFNIFNTRISILSAGMVVPTYYINDINFHQTYDFN